MTKKHLLKIKNLLREMRKSPSGRKANDLITIAKQMGRVLDNRGKEPNYVRKENPKLSPPLSIPGHPGDLKLGTARSIIDMLLDDVDEWLIFLNDSEGEEDDN